MVISTDKCNFEIYIINDDTYTDYDLGDIFDSVRENGYDVSDDVFESAEEIANELYKSYSGQFKFVIEINFTYIKTYDYYSGEYEYDLDYDYNVINKETTDYFDNM